MALTLLWGSLSLKKWVGMSAWKRERVWDQREDEGYRWLVEFDGFPWQLLRILARDFTGLAASRVGG
jgi:hypothetical protein